ncbi:CPBP family intramembrane metalloprotease [Mameliella sp. CS4]|uniref:CPBP family intramembrane glutamic endopeptidase n=1 Tax=Mameliella sp. CS4 TaxID=2862329 RepID=UPI001C5EDF1F|nr:CPBP family intramembrane glutamic endopeptidase [Mameliella sp. CS4]MBW4981035.1 CPBP family intramembrane metalloprotease [Mameliella sp. CS4]
MAILPEDDKAEARRVWLWVEFACFFAVIPAVIALAFPPDMMFPLLFGFTALGVVLLHITPGFDWRSLGIGAARVDWRLVAGFAAVTAVTGYAVVQMTAPEAAFALIRLNPALMLMIAALYPFLSALPQELVFRPLFFRRYGGLLPGGTWPPLVLNATLFSFAHLMYWSWIVAGMTFFGGLAFAWAYERRGSFAEAVVLHAIAGVILFALGLGVFFYSGNVVRPF